MHRQPHHRHYRPERRHHFWNIARYALLLWCIALPAQADLRGLPQITVLAASSLTEPLTEIARLYSTRENITVTTSFDDSKELIRKIEQGDSVDVIITAHPQSMQVLKQQGLIDVYSLSNIVRNRLALVRSRYNRPLAYTDSPEENIRLLHYYTMMVVADPDTTTLGYYSRQALDRLSSGENNLWDAIQDKVMRGASGKNTLYLIIRSNTAGIIYASDATTSEEVVIINLLDDSLYEPIIYQGAVVAGESMSHARDFMGFLQSDIAKKIFKKHGFMTE